jgi:REP-associated tyrosine transposase
MGDEDPDLDGARRGDREAFGRLVRRHQRRVYAAALHILGNHSDADDATQEALVRALGRALGRVDYRVVHVSIQHNHIHFLVEADDARALARGMQGLAIAAARAINRGWGRTGKVFAFRYHATPIASPRQARHALAYVLNNWRRHREDARGGNEHAIVDRFSSAVSFAGWAEVASWKLPGDYDPLPVAAASSWLLRVGWQKHPRISVFERPGAMH